ncbi:hypothetical protein QJQ45_014971 [Haematococcus lacustris]|nr:hypothetical protein QJQ45_014971 [Haematococcus lacustris]
MQDWLLLLTWLQLPSPCLPLAHLKMWYIVGMPGFSVCMRDTLSMWVPAVTTPRQRSSVMGMSQCPARAKIFFVANMSQLHSRHKCQVDGEQHPAIKRSHDTQFGPLPREDKGAPVSADMQRAVRRRIGLFLVTQQAPFMTVDNIHLQAAFQLLGLELLKKHYRTQLLDELYKEVKQVTMKELRELAKIAILVGAGVAACSDYRSGPKLQPRVKNGKRPGLSKRYRQKQQRLINLQPQWSFLVEQSIPTRALEPWHTLGLLASSLVFTSATG